MENQELNLRHLTLYDVARAVEEDRIAINFQPVVHAKDTRFVSFQEGLIRMFDQEGHLRQAGEFIPIIEGTEVGNYVDQVALELTLNRLHADPSIRLSVNMSTQTLWDEDWLYLLKSSGEANLHTTERLIVEFTEASAINSLQETIEFMKYCRKYGVCFACDDFGSGNTVLGHLRDFDFDILKIDGSICQNIGENKDNQIIMTAILSIAEHFDMLTVAEHIDNKSAANKCKELGVDALQGFLFGRGEIFNPTFPNLVARASTK